MFFKVFYWGTKLKMNSKSENQLKEIQRIILKQKILNDTCLMEWGSSSRAGKLTKT